MADFALDRDSGRSLRVHTVGTDDGPLVIYLHGAPSSRLDVVDLHDRSARRGTRVAAFDRPGYGASTYAPYTFDSVADDVCAVADHLDAERFVVLGQSAGAPYALATAALRPARVVAAVTGGAGAPFAPGALWWDHLSPDEQRGVQLIGVDDVEAERLLAQADLPFVEATQRDDEGLYRFWYDLCGPADRRFFESGFRPYLLASLRESLRPGQAGWARDNLVRMGPWPFDLGAISCPTTIWFGEQDDWQPGEWIVERVPHARLRIVPDRGHFVVFEDWDDILDDLGL